MKNKEKTIEFKLELSVFKTKEIFFSFVFNFSFISLKVEWYNTVVEEKYHLPYDPDTVAIVVLSTPDMFDLAFKPFLLSGSYTGSKDGIDECIKYYMQKVNQVRMGCQFWLHCKIKLFLN